MQFKRILSMILVVMMLVSMLPTAAFADGEATHECTYTISTTAPTCEEQGYTTTVCACGAVNVVDNYVDALGHSYVDGVCANCGEIEVVPMNNEKETKEETETECEHQYGEGVVTAPTCTVAGYTTYTCILCSASYSDSEVAALGHSYAEGACSVCGEAEPVEEEAECEHEYANGVCTKCEAACEHSYGEEHLCTVCGAKEPLMTSTAPANEGERTDVVRAGGEHGTLDAAITAANEMTGAVTVEIYGKVYYTDSTPSLTGAYDSISFVGETDDAEISITSDANNGGTGYISGVNNDCKVNFSNLKLSKATAGYANDAGFMNVYFTVYRTGDVSYTNCVFPDGACSQGTNTTYNSCTFANQTSGEYSLWVYANTDVTVNGGSFSGVRGVKMYGEDKAKTSDLTLDGVTFNSSVTEKPAIVLTYGESVTIKEGTTFNNVYKDTSAATTFELDVDGDPNGTTVTSDVDVSCYNDNGTCGVLVDGKIYTTVADAAEVATAGSTVTLLHNSTETVQLPIGVTLNKNGYTAEGVTASKAVAMIGKQGYTTLQAAVDAAVDGDTITLVDNVTEVVTITQKADLNLVIDGAGNTFTGVMTVFGDARHDGAETLTIKNINFVASAGASSCIVSPDRTVQEPDRYSYSHNVTVEKCTFTDSDGTVDCAAIRHEDGGDKNWTVTNCSVDATMHSLLQVNNVNGQLTVSGCTVNSKNGLNLNSCTNVELTGNFINVQGYAVRAGVKTGGNLGEDKSIVMTRNTLKSACADGDAVIMLRASAVDAGIDMSQNVVSGTTHFSGVTDATTVNAEANYWDGKEAPVVSGTAIAVDSYYSDAELTTLVKPAKGNDFTGYTRGDAIWGETWGNATKSFVIKVLDANGNVMGTTSLNNVGGIIDGDVKVTWSLNLDAASNTDEYWNMSWTTAPTIDNQPAKVELWVDGTKVSGGDVVLNAPDNLNKIVAANVDADGKILSYHTKLADAMAAGDTVAVLRDVSESIQNFSDVTLVANTPVKVENTYVDDDIWVDLDNITIGENVAVTVASAATGASEGENEAVNVVVDGSLTVTGTYAIGRKAVVSGNIIANNVYIYDADVSIANVKAESVTVKDGVALEANIDPNTKLVTFKKKLGGLGTADNPYLINDLEDLIIFRDKVNAGDNYSGKYVKLANDINLNNEEWTPIGYMGKTFKGTFDGNEKTIYNLKITKGLENTAANNGIGFFGRTDDPAVIKNLNIVNADVSGSLYVGAVVGYAYTGKTIENCKVTGNITIDAWWYAGVIGGNGYLNTINNCHVTGNDGSYVKGNNGSYIGGIWGFRGEGANSITNCSVTNVDITGVDRVGGISGIAHYGNSVSNNAVKNVTIQATDPEATTVGLVVGATQGTSGSPSIISKNTVTETTAKAGDKVVTALYGTDIDGNAAVTNYVVSVNGTEFETLAEAAEVAKAGDTITILNDTAFEGTVTLPADVVLNGNGKTITGTINADGNLTIKGHTKVTGFSAGFDNHVITIGEGACLEVTGTGRVTVGWGNTFNITGSIEDAKTADKANTQPSLIIPGGISITGSGATLNVTDAYVQLGLSTSKNSGATDTFDFNFTNSIVDFSNNFSFATSTSGKTPVFDIDVKDSVLNMAKNLDFSNAACDVLLDNSVATVGSSMRNDGTLNLTNGSVLTVESQIQPGEHGGNNGTITVDASALTMECSSIGHAMDGNNVGKLEVVNGGSADIDYIIESAITVDTESSFKATQLKDCSVTIDAENYGGGELNINIGSATTDVAVSVINNNYVAASVVNGVVSIGERELSGEGSATDPYLIENLNDLLLFAKKVNAGNTYSGKYVKLNADIDLNNMEWTPISKFQGHFDGGYHTISNLVINGTGKNDQGFFGHTDSGSVSNLTFENAKVSGRLNVGVVAGTPYTSKYTNITVTGHVEVDGMSYVGGVGGKNAYANWTDITVDVDSSSYVKATSTENGIAYRTYVGGVIGFMGEGGHTFKNISSNIAVIGDVCDIGGITGIAHYGNKFENVSCSATVTNTNTDAADATETGGIAGTWHNQVGQTVTFTGCSFTGTVNAAGVDVSETNAVVGAAYNVSNDTPANSGSLVIDGAPVWPVVAKIGDVEYGSIAAAIEAAKEGATITLVCDVAEVIEIPAGKELTLDLNGKTLTGSILAPNATLTIKNGSIVNTDASVSALEINAGELTLSNVNMDSARHALRIDGTVEATIDGGTYRAGIGTGKGTYHAVNVSGAANVIINSGTFVGPKGTTADSGAAVNVRDNATIEINGGSFSGGKNNTLAAAGDENLEVYGGSFDQAVDAKYCALGFVPTKLAENVYGVKAAVEAKIGNKGYATLADAVDAAKEGDTILLQASVIIGTEIIVDKNITIADYATYTVSSVGAGAFHITGNNVLTLDRVKVNNVPVYADSSVAGAKVNGELVTGVADEMSTIYSDGTDVTVTNPAWAAKLGEVYYMTIAKAIEAAQPGNTVTIFAGDYTQNLDVNKAITVEGEQDDEGNNLVNITGKLNITADGAIVKGLNVNNGGSSAGYIGAKDVLVEDCTVVGGNGFRYCYTTGTVTFRNSTITGATYGIHFDGKAGGNIVIENCVITGWTSFAATIEQVTIEKTTFADGNYNVLRFYQNAELNEVTVPSDMRIDTGDGGLGKEGVTVKVNNCKTSDGSSIAARFPDDVIDVSDIIVDGVRLITPEAKIGETEYDTLAEAIAAIGAGNVVIELVADATLDYNAREAYGTADTTSVTIDGADKYTLTLNQKDSDWSSIGLANAGGKLVLKDMTIEKTGYGDTSGAWNTHAIIFSSELEMNNVTVNNGIAVQNGATLNNVTINEAGDYYGLWINGNGQTVTVNGGEINATKGRGIKIADQYIDAPASVTLNVTGTEFNTAKKAAVLVTSTAGAKISASDVDIIDVKADNENFVWVDEDRAAYYDEVTVTGGTKAQEALESFAAAITVEGKVVAYYNTLAAALTAAKDGDTVTLLWAEGAAPIAMNGVVCGKTVTITGTATVDWSKGNLFIGREGPADGKVIFDNAKLTSASNNASTGIHVSGRQKGTDNKYNGTLEIKNSTIELDYLINKGTITLDNSTLTVKNGFSIGGRPASETEDGKDATATLTLTNGSKVVVNNHNGMGLGYEAIGIMNVDASSSFETTQSFLVTAKGTLNLAGTAKIAGTLTNNGSIVLTDADATLTSSDCGNVTTDVSDYKVAYEDGAYKLVAKVYVAKIGEQGYETLAEAVKAVKDGETINILAPELSEGTIKLPAALKNVTFKGEEGAVLKDMTIMASDGNSIVYEGLTFDGIIFDNSRITITGWRNGEERLKDLTVTNCVFKNLNDTTNNAPVHINVAATKPVNGFTFTNNTIDGATGGQKSGVYAQLTGNVTFTGNTINNVSFRPYVIQITTDDGIADTFTVTGNTFSGSAAGRAQGLGNNNAGTDSVRLTVSGNIFKGITNAQQICYWSFNPETTTVDLSKNYYDIDILANPDRIYYNGPAANAEELNEMGIFPYYKDEAMTILVTFPAIEVTYADGTVEYFDDMLEAVPYTTNCPKLEGATIKLLSDIEAPGIRMMENDMVLNLNDHTYTITAGTGSQGTNTSGFQIRPEVTTKAIIKNGTIEVAYGAPVVWMFNVYSTDFVVENVTVDCTNMAWSYGEDCYVAVSRAGDNVQFTGNTKIENFDSTVAGNAINVGGTMTIGENVVPGGTIELDADATLIAPANLAVVTVDGYVVVYSNGVYSSVAQVASINEQGYATLDEAFNAAQPGDEVKILKAGTYALTTSGKDITITGAVDGVVFDNIGAKNMGGANVTFNKVTFDYYPNVNYTGLQHSGDLVYNNCTINGQVFLYGQSETFNNCTFNQNSADAYNVWTYGAKEVAFNECTFNSAGKSVLIYNEGKDMFNDVTVTDCDFIASAPVEGKAAIEMDSSLTAGINLTIAGETEATGFGTGNVSGNSLWNNKKGNEGVNNDITVTVNDVVVLQPIKTAEVNGLYYTTLEAAVAAANADDTVTLITDVTLTETITIEKAITLDLGDKIITGADNAIVFNVKADTTIKNGAIKGNKSGTSSGLIDIYADLNMDGVSVETSKINALRFKAGDCTATLENCAVTGAFKGYGGSVWNIKSGTYKASSTAINDQLNGTASITGGIFHYEIAEDECALGYVVVANTDGTYTVKYAPACFVDANNNGVLDEGEAVYGNLDQVFAKHKEGDVHVVLTADIVANAQVDTDADAKYYFTTNVAEGVKMDFLFADDWNYVQKMSVGENITLNAPYLLAWTEFELSGTVNTGYFYTTGAKTTVNEGATLNATTGDATVQVKNGAEFTVNGTVNTKTLNVWAGESKLIVSGENAQLNADWIDIWDGTPTVTVKNGATLDVDSIKASRGGSITVDAATLKSDAITLGHNGDSKGELTVTNNGVIDGETKLTAMDSIITGPEGLNVTTDIADCKVVYENGIYKVVRKHYVAQLGENKYESLDEAIAAIGAGDVVIELVADATLDYNARDAYGTAETTSVTINGNGNTLTLNQKNSDWSSIGLKNADAELVLNNMTIEKTGYGDTSGAWNTHAIIFSCPVEMDNVTVNNGIAVQDGATLNNVTINEANGYYGLWINGNGQTVTVNSGAINATNGGRGIKIADQYIDAPASVKLTVDGTEFNTAKKAAVLVTSTAGAEITASNVDITKVAEDNVNFVWVDEDRAAYYGEVSVTGVTKAQEALETFAAELVDAENNVVGYYKALNAAVEAAEEGASIKVLNNHELKSGFTVDETLAIDLNGKTVTYTSTEHKADAMITNNGNLTITDSSETKTGKFSYTYAGGADSSYGFGNSTIENKGTLTVLAGTVENASAAMSHASYAINTGAGATLTVSGGKVLNLNGHAIRMTHFGGGAVNVNIEGGYVEGTRAIQVQLPGSASSTTAPDMNLNITGGELKSNESTYNLAVYVFSNGQSAENVNINISGGTINGNVALNAAATKTMKDDAAVVTGGTINGEYGIFSYADDADAIPVIMITGGTFATNYSEFYAVDDGCVFVQNENGSYNVEKGTIVATVNGEGEFITLKAAIDAAKAGDTVKVINNVYLTEGIVLDKNLTIDLGDKDNKIVCARTEEGEYFDAFTVLADVTFTGEGTVDASAADGYAIYVGAHDGTVGNVTVNSGKFVGATSAAQVTKGSLNIAGGEFSAYMYDDSHEFLLNCIDANYKDGSAKIEITGGTFYYFDPSNNAAEGEGTNYVADNYVAVTDNNGKTYTVRQLNAVAMIDDVSYETVSEALAAAKSGEVVELVADATEGYVIIPVGVTLDLNSHTLTADYVVGFNGSKLTGISTFAKLVIAENSLVLSDHYVEGMFRTLPVWVEDHYEFSQFVIYDYLDDHGLKIDLENDTISFKFRGIVSPDYYDQFNDGGSNNEVSAIVELKWDNEFGGASQRFEYSDKQVATVFTSVSNDFSFTLKGFSTLGVDIDTLKIRGIIVTDCGIEVSTAVFES